MSHLLRRLSSGTARAAGMQREEAHGSGSRIRVFVESVQHAVSRSHGCVEKFAHLLPLGEQT
jgi:hypothetical protein